MNNSLRYLSSFLLALVLLAPFAFTGCAARVSTGYRVYDVDHTDYHSWDNGEVVYYQRWENDTHRHHRDFRKRSEAEQHEYW